MKILFDLKPLQYESSFRGIGKVCYELSKRLINHIEEPYLMFSEKYAERGLKVYNKFKSINKNIHSCIFTVGDFTTYFDIYNQYKKEDAFITFEILYEWSVSQINPDILFIFSFFEWDHPVSIKKLNNNYLNIVIAHDLIPYIFKDKYLNSESIKIWYMHKFNEFKDADIFFANSENTKLDLIKYLNIPEEKIKVIPLSCNEIFKKLPQEEIEKIKPKIKEKYGLKDNFILYVPGGSDFRKNIKNLIDAFSLLSENIRNNYDLVIGSKLDKFTMEDLKNFSKKKGINVMFTGYLSEEELLYLYNLASLFVYPSLYEGFGLPVIEAMRCETPTICSNSSSLKEIGGIKEALFDPNNPKEIAEKITMVLTNQDYKNILIENAKIQSEKYSWDKAVEIIMDTIKEISNGRK